MKLLSPVDHMFLRLEAPRTPMHIGAFAVFELPEGAGPEFTRELHEAFRQLAFLPFPFDSVVERGPLDQLPHWRRVDPDPDYHVRFNRLPVPGGERELGALVERLHSTPLDLTRPLWEAHLIEGLQGNRFAFYFKAHHCAVDGTGAMNLVKRWLTTDPSAPAGSEPEPTVPSPGSAVATTELATPRLAETFARNAVQRVADGVSATGELTGKLLAMVGGAHSSVIAALRTPKAPFNTRLTAQRRLAVEVLDLAVLKQVARATGTTVNDVTLAAVGAAVRRYLAELEALPKSSVTVSVPVGFDRDEDTLNAATGFVTPIATDQEDPLRRLAVINAGTARGKRELAAMSQNALQHYTLVGLLPLFLGQHSGALPALPPLFNFTVSNVVLSKEPLYLNGARLQTLVPVSFLADGYGLNLTLVGYGDSVALGFVGCRDVLPHLQRLARYTSEGLDELVAAVAATGSAEPG